MLIGELSRACLTPLLAQGFSATSPGHVHRGDIELDPFEPEHHEEALAEGAVSDVFSIQTSLPGKQKNEDLTLPQTGCPELESHWAQHGAPPGSGGSPAVGPALSHGPEGHWKEHKSILRMPGVGSFPEM